LHFKLETAKDKVISFVDPKNTKAMAKARHYLSALDEQLRACDETDEMIRMLNSPFPRRRQ